MSDGTTGNDIIELLCPGGELGEDTLFELNQFAVAVGSETAFYQVLAIPGEGTGCVIAKLDADAQGLELPTEVYETCRRSLIERCDLQRISPIPTLSQWGMIATAGVLGVIGLYVSMRRRKAAV